MPSTSDLIPARQREKRQSSPEEKALGGQRLRADVAATIPGMPRNSGRHDTWGWGGRDRFCEGFCRECVPTDILTSGFWPPEL